jgi:Bacterial protein of unknown function (DUF937)
MATNLVSEIADVLPPTIVSRIASALGLNQTSTQKAIVAAIPAILAALASSVSKPQGVAKLNDVVAKQEPGVLSSLASVIGEPGQKALIDQGAGVLSALIGGKTSSALTSAVGRYAGIEGGGAKNLLGLLAPLVLGVLGHEKRDSGLDASGLANLLTSQQSNIARALPSGFSKYLTGTGILDDVSVPTAKAPARASSAPTSPTLRWILGAVALLVLGALAWNLLRHQHHRPTEVAPTNVETPNVAQPGEAPYAGLLAKLQGIKAGDVDVGQLATAAVNDLYSSVVGIKDEATAESAVPGLTKDSSEFDQLDGLLNQLSPENRKLLADTLALIKPNLDQLLDKALAIPGVGDKIKPTVDALRAKLDTLTKS